MLRKERRTRPAEISGRSFKLTWRRTEAEIDGENEIGDETNQIPELFF